MVIDLRSDTVTAPDDAMRRAMAAAEVGDDVFEEDPTVRRLQEEAAAAMGTEAALFVPSGTMGNQISLRLLAAPGTEVLGDAMCHVFNFEMGAMAALSGLLPRPISSQDGLPTPEQVAAAVRPELSYLSRSGALVVENTHNLGGGTVFDRDRIDPLLEAARRHGLSVHLDGARIFNAAAALGVSPARLAEGFDTVMFCLSKGLGAPVGSMLCSDRLRIAEARRVRKMFGGGMRQVGVLAAAGLVALREGPARLAEDHANARFLSEALAGLPGLRFEAPAPRTNIVMVGFEEREDDPSPAPRLAESLRQRGVLVVAFGPRALRLVTHRDVDRRSCEVAARAFEEALSS